MTDLLHKLTQNSGRNHWEGVGFSHPPQFKSVKSASLFYTNNTSLMKIELCINVYMLVNFYLTLCYNAL